MKVKEIINYLESQGDWVNWSQTRDYLLLGDESTDVDKVIVCWVATIDVINQAIDKGCHFIISHENPFYMYSTGLPSKVREAQKRKMELLKKNNISIYRCHDLWDLYPKYGVRDMWSKTLNFETMQSQNPFVKIAQNVHMSVDELAKDIIHKIEPYYQFGVEIIGDRNKKVEKVGFGTGACTDIFTMIEAGADACIVSDDGINNWIEVQWAVDYQIPLIIVNHMACEAAGLIGLQEYLSKEFPNLNVEYIANDYGVFHIEK